MNNQYIENNSCFEIFFRLYTQKRIEKIRFYFISNEFSYTLKNMYLKRIISQIFYISFGTFLTQITKWISYLIQLVKYHSTVDKIESFIPGAYTYQI